MQWVLLNSELSTGWLCAHLHLQGPVLQPAHRAHTPSSKLAQCNIYCQQQLPQQECCYHLWHIIQHLLPTPESETAPAVHLAICQGTASVRLPLRWPIALSNRPHREVPHSAAFSVSPGTTARACSGLRNCNSRKPILLQPKPLSFHAGRARTSCYSYSACFCKPERRAEATARPS